VNYKLTDGIIKANTALKCINLTGLQNSLPGINTIPCYP
jgi:hypothetical protein